MSAATIFMSVLFGAIGMAMFTFGKRQESIPHIAAGIALIAFPYMVTNWVAMGLIGLVLTVAPFFITA